MKRAATLVLYAVALLLLPALAVLSLAGCPPEAEIIDHQMAVCPNLILCYNGVSMDTECRLKVVESCLRCPKPPAEAPLNPLP